MKIKEIVSEAKSKSRTKSGRGPKQGWKGYCTNTPADKMPASWLSSCKARGLKSRDTGKSQKRGSDGKRVKLDGKKAKSTKYGGWVSPTKTG
jgi:hypothetical protein